MGGTGTVDVTGGKAAMTAGESETTADQGGGIVVAGGEAMFQVQGQPEEENAAARCRWDRPGAELMCSEAGPQQSRGWRWKD